MSLRVGSANFSKGEISPELAARVDVAARNTGVAKARNVIVQKYGGLTKRPGTRIVAEVRDSSAPVRLIPFQFSITQTYALELGQGYMRPAALGGMVVETAFTIVGITQANPATITVPFHGYSVGDDVFFTGVLGMIEINGLIGRVLTVPDANTMTVAIDTTGFSLFAGDTGGLLNTAPPPAPPAPPVVPPVVPDPPPPATGGGGGGGNFCVVATTPILLADGTARDARDCTVGTMLWTRHEDTMAWGAFPVVAHTLAWDAVFSAEINGVTLRATADHRFWIEGEWVAMATIGEPDGSDWVVKMTVEEAHTYISAGILSHNLKRDEYIP